MSWLDEDHTGQCCTCTHWDADRRSDDVSAQGQCRAHPPRVIYVPPKDRALDHPFESEWPWTMGADWCGEWRVRR